MAVQQVIRALGSWSLTLRDLPQDIFDQLDQWRFGHIAVDVARENPNILGDALLGSCRYAGVLISTERDGDTVTIGGSGMAFWLGSADKVGDVFETAVEFTAAPFETVITGLLPASGAVTAGNIEAPTFGAVFPDTDLYPGEDVYPAAAPVGVAGSYTGKHQWQSPREAIDYVTDLFNCDWRVNNNATLDAGDASSLFVTNPTAAIVRRAEGGDQDLRGLPGSAKLGRDVEDFSTRVINLAEGNGRTVAVGTADIDPGLNPYLDLHGNPVKLARILSESNTSKTNADARAALALAAYTAPRDSLDLSTDAYDISGDIAAGDSVWVYDPDAGLVDEDASVQFRGERIHPVKLRVFSLTWPVTFGMGVYFRNGLGEWLDLSDWVVWEGSGTQVTVGGYDRSLTNTNREAPGSRVVADSSVPGVPALVLPFATSVYQSTSGFSRARITASWVQPTNTDGTTIVDGNRYEVEYRNPPGTGAWSQVVAPFDSPTATIRELLPATTYGLRVRAVDSAVPPNSGAWSLETATTTAGDTVAPATPAAPVVAGNPVSIQVRHTLGAATGGTYNLAPDLRVLEVHASEVGSGFTPDASTKLGNLTATYSMLLANVPAIGTFSVASTATLYVKVIAVDESGNASTPSAAATVTAALISDIYVSNVSATKLSAGDFTATYGVTGLMISGNPTGSRFESGTRGLLTGGRTYRPSNTLAISLDAGSGDLTAYQPNGTTRTFRLEASTGNVYLYKSDGTTPAMQLTASTGLLDLSGKLTSGAGVGVGRTIVVDPNSANPEIRLYPNSSTSIFAYIEGIAGNDAAGPGWLRAHSGVGTAGAKTTLTLQPSSASIRYAPGGLLNGGYVDIDSAGATLGFFKDETVESSLTFFNTGNARIRTDNGTTNNTLFVEPGQVYASLPFGTTGGFRFRAQNGYAPAAGYRFYVESSDNTLRIVDNQANAYVNLGGPGGAYKTFVIPNPVPGREDRWLVHACTESPQAGVEYWGEAEIVDGFAEVQLPDYFESLTNTDGRAVLVSMALPDEPLTALVDGPVPPAPIPPLAWAPDAPKSVVPESAQVYAVAASRPRNGRFRVSSAAPDGTRVAWLVKAVRSDLPPLVVEPYRTDVDVRGDGPYRHITPRENRAA